VPLHAPFGFENPDEFFYVNLLPLCSNAGDAGARFVSIGSGNCDLEIRLAEKLLASGQRNFVIECIDLNPDMLARGRDAAAQCNVGDHLQFTQADFNLWRPGAALYDGVLANQSLHHVLKLEHLFESIRVALKPGGRFIISDMIGRNGHQRWPEALKRIQGFWRELPEAYRVNRLMQRYEARYINHDCSTEGFEGIRAQDILPLLNRYFSFAFFLPYGNLVFPFIDRAFGHNFDAGAAWDRDFIDRVHALDEALIISGEITPTSMLAVVQSETVSPILRHPNLTPERCIRRPFRGLRWWKIKDPTPF
jgi:SAM-dependent methyltransferase